jgi:hypothetical protein
MSEGFFMKWEAHTRTAEKILADFDAYHFRKYEKDLINGIIYPDSNDPNSHSRREDTIRNCIKKSRERRLDYNPNDSFFYLGMAFHYIQDKWVGLDPDHEDYPHYERVIDKCAILDFGEDLYRYYPVQRQRVLNQFKRIEEVLKTRIKTPEELYSVALMSRPYESIAFLDLNLSYRICFRVAEMVLRPMLNVSLNERLTQTHSEYTGKLVKTEESEVVFLHELNQELGQIETEGTMNGIKKWKQERNIKTRNKSYEKGRHLEKIRAEYSKITREMSKPFSDWYNVEVPELKLETENVKESKPETHPSVSIDGKLNPPPHLYAE